LSCAKKSRRRRGEIRKASEEITAPVDEGGAIEGAGEYGSC